jgi:hypothetical protein
VSTSKTKERAKLSMAFKAFKAWPKFSNPFQSK